MSLETELMRRPEFRDLSRSYGPGKFDTRESEYLWELSLEGVDSECGEVDTTNHYALLRGTFEHPQLSGVVGAIVETTDQGFVYSETFTDTTKLEEAWAQLETETADCGAE